MRERHEVALGPTTAAHSMIRIGKHNCGDQHDIDGGRECNYVADIGHDEGLLRIRDDDAEPLNERKQLISISPTLVVTVEGSLPTNTQSSRTSTISPLSTRSFSSSTSSSSSSSSFSSSTHKFTPTGYQTIVPTYPPFSFSTTSSSSSSTPSNTTNWSSIGTKLGLGLGIPILVLLVLLLTILLHRRQARRAKKSSSHYYHCHQHTPIYPEMATAADTRLHPAPSSRFSTAGSMVVAPAPGITNTPKMTQLYSLQPPSPSPPPAVPKRNSARLLFAGPLNSHPPPMSPPSIRPASSIYDEADNWPVLSESMVALGGNGVGNVLSQYLDTNSAYLNGPWDPGQVEDVPALPLPLKTTPRARQEEQTRQYLSVNVDHSPGGIEEVSPLSSSGSGPYIPARISGMSGMSPVSPGRTQSRRRT